VPTYQYACTECDHRFEAVQAFTDDSLTVCPVCGGSLRKVYGSVGVVFKGSGFYRTDSRASATSTAAGNGSGEKSPAGEKSADKSGDKSSGSEKSSDKKAAASTGDSKGASANKTPASSTGSTSTTKAAS